MAGKKGFAAVPSLRARARRATPGALALGGNAPQASALVRDAADALAVCVDAWLDALRSRNYSESTLEGRAFSLRFFAAWAQERDVTRAAEVTRPILEAYQRWLSRYEQKPGKRLSW